MPTCRQPESMTGVEVQEGDMRQMPLDSGTFDAAVSAYASRGKGFAARSPRWRGHLVTAGFAVAEQGVKPGTLYFLCRKR